MTGDLFFDIEGARYYSEDSREFGVQYLFGVVDTADLYHYNHYEPTSVDHLTELHGTRQEADGTAAGDAGLQTVAGYNEDDCPGDTGLAELAGGPAA